MILTEPITTLTDYAITIEAIACSGILLRVGYFRQQVATQLWAAAFGCIAIAAGLGGTFHGSALLLDDGTRSNLWQLVLYALSAASSLMLAATIISSIAQQWQRGCLAIVGIKFLLSVVWALEHQDFSNAAVDYLAAMLVVLVLQGWMVYRQQTLSAQWIIAGIFVSFIATAVQLSQLVLAVFNHNDLYHLVQMVALYLFYRGARSLKARSEL
jgi:hypothetical protein